MKMGRTEYAEEIQFYSAATSGSWCLRLRRLGKELVRNSGIGVRHRALDVACGTGIVARPTADRVAPSSSVVGLDAHAAMLTVARVKNDAGTVQTGKSEVFRKLQTLNKPRWFP
jgi:2-polyprenyl-3-methyl-5-hydroxy-6-metoxy-1,4-benzoquinol methylase